LPDSRRARRPASQSSKLITPCLGMQGTFDSDFITHLRDQVFADSQVIVFRQRRNPAHFWPVHFQPLFQCRECFCIGLKQLRVLGAIPAARSENKHQGGNAQYDAEGCFLVHR
jgi:hypothetical protein